MDLTYPSILLVPVALGLLGFIEPCTVGAHLVFLRLVAERSRLQRAFSTLAFASVRTAVMGSFGAATAFAGSQLIALQTGFWVFFGSLYLLIGLAYAAGRAGAFERRINLAPAAWKNAANPVALGVAFGLNIPACAAPILFGLIGLAASSGAVALGFLTMAVFGLALSLPLALIVALPSASAVAEKLSMGKGAMRWVFSILFIVLGGWSLWFGFFVDPADWALL